MIYIKTILFSLLLSIPLLAISQGSEEKFSHHCYFEENSMSIGIGLPYSPDLKMTGINGRLYYNIGEQICFGPEVSFFKNSEIKVVDLNFVGHYIFETSWFGVFPLAGANYTIEKKTEHEKESAFGLVYGVGIHRNFRRITVAAEYTRVASELPDQFITVALLYTFKWK